MLYLDWVHTLFGLGSYFVWTGWGWKVKKKETIILIEKN